MSNATIREVLAAEVGPWLRAAGQTSGEEVTALIEALMEAGPITGAPRRKDIIAARLAAAAIFDHFHSDIEPVPSFGQPGATVMDFARDAYVEADGIHTVCTIPEIKRPPFCPLAEKSVARDADS